MSDTPKLFPLQVNRNKVQRPAPTKIPWSIADKAYSVYSAKYGTSQSLERLAERGGFSQSEMDMFYPEWETECSEITRLIKENERLESELEDSKITLAQAFLEFRKDLDITEQALQQAQDGD